MGLLDTISTARRGLGAASTGIDVTSQNISNVNTVGYSRRKVVQTTTDPVSRRGLFMGSGPAITGIARATDRLLGVRLVSAAGTAAEASTVHETLANAEGRFDGTALSDATDAFFDSLSALTTDPSDAGGRRAVVAAASGLAASVARIGSGLQDDLDDIDASVATRLESVNSKLAEVASLNKAIGRLGADLGPGDLLDRRDQLVRELGEEVGATVDFDADGQATVLVGGHAVVSGSEARTLRLDTSGATPELLVAAGSGTLRVTGDAGGAIGGALAARAKIEGWVADLDDFATNLATTVNAQHAAGFDAAGNPGGDVFTFDAADPAASLAVSAALDDPDALALAGAATASPGDGDNLAAFLALESSAAYDGGTRTAASALAALASLVGSDVSTAETDATTLEDQLADVDSMRDSLATVDTDEEAIKLIEFQTAYRAAARVLSVGDEMLRTLLTIGS
ncbi:MAG: flagellar hook-associated protein FlgK [Pseudomonadota bacterium]|nr:flagellar hook-associated protein FlgK [Pseudomonadota bacterium]